VFVIANLGQGITSVLPDWPARRSDKADGARIARLIERRGVSRLLLNPALVAKLADHGIPAQVHSIFTGGGPVYPDVVHRIVAARPDLRLVCVYGSTEAEPIAEMAAKDISPADWAAMAAGQGLLAGHPVFAARVRIVDDEIQVAGNHVVQGYLDPARDAETKVRDAQGTLWHRTGDAGRIDADGRLWLLGRIGARVGELWPFPIEVAARGWPGVRRAALADVDGRPALVIEGHRQNIGLWQASAAALSIDQVRVVDRLPMDRRRGSKVDMAALRKMLDANASR
jgi:olefin beta-lactone synthetase